MSNGALEQLAARFEAASQRYATLHGIVRDRDWFMLKLQEEVGELTQAWLRHTQRARQKALPEQVKPTERAAAEKQALADEAADVLGHVLLLAHQLELDLSAAVARKWRFDPHTVNDQ